MENQRLEVKSIEGKIIIFKTLAISKILNLGLITSLPAFIIELSSSST